MAPKIFAPFLSCLGVRAKSRPATECLLPAYEPKYSDKDEEFPDFDDFDYWADIPPPPPGPFLAPRSFVQVLLSADSQDTLHLDLTTALNQGTCACGLTEKAATEIFVQLEIEVASGYDFWNGTIMKEAFKKADAAFDAEIGFAKYQHGFCEVIAMGILIIVGMPRILHKLGFTEDRLVPGSFAATWHGQHVDRVPSDSLFSYFQRLGMNEKH